MGSKGWKEYGVRDLRKRVGRAESNRNEFSRKFVFPNQFRINNNNNNNINFFFSFFFYFTKSDFAIESRGCIVGPYLTMLAKEIVNYTTKFAKNSFAYCSFTRFHKTVVYCFQHLNNIVLTHLFQKSYLSQLERKHSINDN